MSYAIEHNEIRNKVRADTNEIMYKINKQISELGLPAFLKDVKYESRYDSYDVNYGMQYESKYGWMKQSRVEAIVTVEIDARELHALLQCVEDFRVPNNPMARKAFDEYLMIKKLCEGMK